MVTALVATTLSLLLNQAVLQEPATQPRSTDSLPEQLRAAVLARSGFRSIRIRYCTYADIPQQGIKWEQIREDRLVGSDHLTKNLGNKDGIVHVGPGGSSVLGHGTACAPIIELVSRTSGDVWRWIKGEHTAGLFDQPLPGYCDPRVIGLQPYPGGDKTPEQLLDQWNEFFGGRTRWKVDSDAKQVRVRAEIKSAEGNEESWEWWIDPAMGMAVTRATRAVVEKDRTLKPMISTETTYEKVGGRWFPKLVKEILPDGSHPFVIEVLDVEFDSPGEPLPLSPKEIGMPVGLYVVSPTRWGESITKRWNGEEAISKEDFVSRNPPYDTSELEAMRKRSNETGTFAYPDWWFDNTGKMGLVDVEYKPSLWEDYVRRWCLQYKADENQRTAARAVLKECQDQAFAILPRVEKDVHRLDGVLASKETSEQQRTAARQERGAILKPIDSLFAELKKRLDGTLRQDQVAGATSKPSSPRRPPPPPRIIHTKR